MKHDVIVSCLCNCRFRLIKVVRGLDAEDSVALLSQNETRSFAGVADGERKVDQLIRAFL